MTPIGLAFTRAIPGGSTVLDATEAGGPTPTQVVYRVPPASQAPAAPSDATQQDTVTLSGRTAANFVTTAAFSSLAQEFTFPPNDSENGASADGATNSISIAASADQTARAQQQPAQIFTPGFANATAVAVAANAAQAATGTNPANATAKGAAATSVSAIAPEETLQQLDQELQRLGINPQDISLMNRMSLLLWVNDPVALRQFVQGMQPSAVSSEKNAAANALSAQSGAAQFGGGAKASRGAGAAVIQSGAEQSQAQNQSAVTQIQTQVPVPSGSQSTGTSNSGTGDSANVPQQQSGAAALQLRQLHASLSIASQDTQGSFTGGRNSQTQGQLVNIST